MNVMHNIKFGNVCVHARLFLQEMHFNVKSLASNLYLIKCDEDTVQWLTNDRITGNNIHDIHDF